MKKFGLLLAGLLLFIYACGPSVEGEKKAWEKTQSTVTQLKSQYPAYAQLIDAKYKLAQKAWEDAKSISDEDKKADKMAEANNYIRKGAVGTLNSLKSNLDNLHRQKDALMKKVAPAESFNNRINLAIQDANTAIDQGEKALYAQGNLTAPDAENSLNMASQKIKSANTTVKGVFSAIDKYVRDQNKKNTTTNNTTTNNTTTTTNNTKTTTSNNTTEKPKEIKCEYCGTLNPATNTKCKNCGAPLKK